NERGLGAALFVTGRLAFLAFWPSYSATALVVVFGAAFVPLQRRAREFGLAFAAIIAVHSLLVLWLSLIGAPPGRALFLEFGIALSWTVLLTALSFGKLHQKLGWHGWRAVKFLGMNYIAYVFALDFTRNPFGGGVKHWVEYAPFAVLSITGPCMRLLAFLRRRGVLAEPPRVCRRLFGLN
ncbi:MAG TPA: hypothetical protein VHO91_05305, partial [Rhodopila sp.]|nr:hypothetical protein [Rhodopila sp.]